MLLGRDLGGQPWDLEQVVHRVPRVLVLAVDSPLRIYKALVIACVLCHILQQTLTFA